MSVSEELYLVEQVRGKRKSLKKLGGVEYFVKWVGFDSSHNTWEPAEHLEACAGLVEQFEEELQKREQFKGKARKRWSETEGLIRSEGEGSFKKDVNNNDVMTKSNVFNRFEKNVSNIRLEDGYKMFDDDHSSKSLTLNSEIEQEKSRNDSKPIKSRDFFEISSESPFYVKNVKVGQNDCVDAKCEPKECYFQTKKIANHFEISPESPFCGAEMKVKQEENTITESSSHAPTHSKDIVCDISDSDSLAKLEPVKIIGVSKVPPLTELHFCVEFSNPATPEDSGSPLATPEDSGSPLRTGTGLIPAKEAYKRIPQMCLQFYEDHIVWE